MSATEESSQPETPNTPRALVVDDDKALSSLLEFILQREGYAVDLFRDGLAASEYIASSPPVSVAVLDIMLPRIDGFALLRQLRELPVWSQIPVLMLSARGDEQDIVRALDAGASDYVQKPFQPEELKARLRRLVRKATR